MTFVVVMCTQIQKDTVRSKISTLYCYSFLFFLLLLCVRVRARARAHVCVCVSLKFDRDSINAS